MKRVVISIVSHSQGDLIRSLLNDLSSIKISYGFEVLVVVTINVPENEGFLHGNGNLSIKTIRNEKIKGFGENHNTAFRAFKSDFFIVVNPDIRVVDFDLNIFLSHLIDGVGVIGPMVKSSAGNLEDSARTYPTIPKVISRTIFNRKKSPYNLRVEHPINVDWIAGMFMAFNSDVYAKIQGFDERYFMYLEDADICRRIWNQHYKIIYIPSQSVIHDAQRSTLKSFRHFKWHLISLIRFITG